MERYDGQGTSLIAANERYLQRVGSEPIDVDEEIYDGPEPTSVATVDLPPADILGAIDQAQHWELGEWTHDQRVLVVREKPIHAHPNVPYRPRLPLLGFSRAEKPRYEDFMSATTNRITNIESDMSIVEMHQEWSRALW